jgi:hypothetical protein
MLLDKRQDLSLLPETIHAAAIMFFLARANTLKN